MGPFKPPGCPNAWISIMRRISSRSRAIRCQRSSWTHFSSLAWLMPCMRHSSLECCLRPLPSLVAAGFHPPQVCQSQRSLNLRSPNWQSLNLRRLTRAPHRPVNRSRNQSPKLQIPTWARPVGLLPSRNCLVGVPKSRSPVNSESMAARLCQAVPKIRPLPPR